jgi:hypothetical protein
MALAEKVLAARYNRPGHAIVDHRTYAFVGDGALMEGVSHEACSLAGTHKLGKLVVLYDDNGISIDGRVQGWFTDDTGKRFAAYGWNVIGDVDGHIADAVDVAIRAARAVARPQGHRRQDRDDQRERRRVVRRLHEQPGRRGVDRPRPAALARRERNRRGQRAADLDRLHAKSAQGRAREAPRGARGPRVAAHQRRVRPARRQRHAVRVGFNESLPRREKALVAPSPQSGGRTSLEVRNQLFQGPVSP